MDTQLPSSPVSKRSIYIASVTLLLTLSTTIIAGLITQQAVSIRLQRFFNREADQIANTYYNKLHTHITILEGLRGLWNSSNKFTQASFNAYLSSYDLFSLDKSGVSTYFYIPTVSSSAVASFEAQLRQEKINDYAYQKFALHPQSNLDVRYPVAYGYPLKGRETALGLDFATFPERLDAITYARDENKLATTKAVTMQTTGKPGFFFLLPLYQPNLPLERTPERKTAFAGVVGAAFRSESAFEQIFGGADPYPDLNFHIYQGEATTADRLLYNNDPAYTPVKPRYSTTRIVRLQGQTWTIVVQSKSSFRLLDIEQRLPLLVFSFGIIMTLILAIFSLSKLAKIRHHSGL